jgi:Domain of unknown function (DUF4394)
MQTRPLLASAAVAAFLAVTGATAAAATSLVALTGDRTLLTIDHGKPAVIRQFQVTGISGRLLRIDVRPADGKLYGIVDSGAVVTIDPRNGKALFKSQLSQTLLSGVRASIDFNPSADRLRIVGSDGTNLRANVDDGVVILDTPLSFAPGPFVPAITPPTLPTVIAAAYTNSAVGTVPATKGTILFDIDDFSDAHYAQVPANGGVLNAVGGRLGISPGEIGFDIATSRGGTNVALLISNNRLYRVGLINGMVGKGVWIRGLNAAVRDLAVLTAS